MSFFKGNPYRDAPEERVIPAPKYPIMKITTPTRRLIQTADDKYIVEKARVAEDTMGTKTTYWSPEVVINPDDDKKTARLLGYSDGGIASEVVVWILKNL